MDKVLIVVDCQNDFMPGGSLAVPNGDEIIPVINKLIESKDYKAVFFTKDWHPKEHTSFASNHNVDPFTMLDGEMKWPDHCVKDTFGAEIHKDIVIHGNTLDCWYHVLYKGEDEDKEEYSALSSYFNVYKIDDELDGSDIDVVGLATEYCVKNTVLDILNKINVTSVNVLLKGCRGISDDGVTKAIEEMINAGAIIIT